MFEERTFQIALAVSIIIHGVALYNIPRFDNESLTRSLQKLEVTYEPVISQEKPAVAAIKSSELPKSSSDLNKIYIKKKSNVTIPDFFKKGAFADKKIFQSKPIIAQKFEIKKMVTLPPTETNIKNPVYLTYYQNVRELIRRAAFRNFTKMHTGEVYVTFVVLRNGVLDKVNLVGEKSSGDEYLEQVALKSLKDSAPFPPFPADLAYPELSFNVIISFEIGD